MPVSIFRENRSWPNCYKFRGIIHITLFFAKRTENFLQISIKLILQFLTCSSTILFVRLTKINNEFSRKIGNTNSIYLIIPSCSLCFRSRSWILPTDTSREVVRLSLSSSRLWINTSHKFLHKHMFFEYFVLVVMSKTKGLTFRYRLGNKTKTFWYRSRICLNENRLFRFGPESAFLDQIEMITFDKTNSGTNSNVLVLFLLYIGTFVERLRNVGSFTVLTLHTTLTMSWVCSFPRPE